MQTVLAAKAQASSISSAIRCAALTRSAIKARPSPVNASGTYMTSPFGSAESAVSM